MCEFGPTGCRVAHRTTMPSYNCRSLARPPMTARPTSQYPRLHAAVAALAALVMLAALAALPLAAASASTSHAGWPPKEYLLMDKGPAGRHHVLVGKRNRHNW